MLVALARDHGVVQAMVEGGAALHAAFIDLGLERDGFLYVAEVVDTLEEFERLEGGDDQPVESGPV